MSLNINISQLRTQANDYVREVFAAQYNRQQADSNVSHASQAVQTFGTELTRVKNELTELLGKAVIAKTDKDLELVRLTGKLIEAERQKANAASSVQRNTKSLKDLQNSTGSTAIDTGTALSINNLKSTLSASQNQLAEMKELVKRARNKIDYAKGESSDLSDVITLINTEIAETDRLIINTLFAAIHIVNYNNTKLTFIACTDRATQLAERVQLFVTDMQNSDAASAGRIEQDFLVDITGQLPLASRIAQVALSQVGASETSDSNVPGKGYAQFGGAWCADFVRWVLEESGIDIDSNGRDALGAGYSFRVARAWSVYGDDGGGYGRMATTADPRPGDLLIDRYNGLPTPDGHISIVIEVNINGDPNLVRTIGGNEDDPVGSSPDAVRNQIKDLRQKDRYLVTLSELNNN